jgi:hypothetical protein
MLLLEADQCPRSRYPGGIVIPGSDVHCRGNCWASRALQLCLSCWRAGRVTLSRIGCGSTRVTAWFFKFNIYAL